MTSHEDDHTVTQEHGRTAHDQLLKEVVEAFLADVVTLFAPEQAAALDFSNVRFLDKETFTDVTAGHRREMDVLAEVRARQSRSPHVRIHVEVQRKREPGFEQRMLHYFMTQHLRAPKSPLLQIALLGHRKGQLGIGVGNVAAEVAGFTAVRYYYIEVSLPNLDAMTYTKEEYPPLAVGLAALMGRGRGPVARMALYTACLRRLAALEAAGIVNPAQLFLLHNLVRTYIPLRDEERASLLAQWEKEGETTVKTSELTWADRMRLEGEARGEAKGKAEGKAEALLLLLGERFGSVPPQVVARVQATSDTAALDALLLRALHVAQPDDLLR